MTVAQINIGQSLQGALDALLSFIPNLIGALLILIIGYFIAKILQKAVRKGLQKLGLDRHLMATPAGGWIDRASPGATTSGAVGKVVFYIVLVLVLVAAVGALGIPAVTTFMNAVLAYLPNVIAAIAIFVIAMLIAQAISGVATRTLGDTPTGKVVATVGPVLVMGIAVFMILTQLRIAPQIVQITFTALIGAIALALALAFGLGGRTVAADMLRTGYDKAQEQAGQVKADTQLAKERAEREAQRAREQVDATADGGSAGGNTAGSATRR